MLCYVLYALAWLFRSVMFCDVYVMFMLCVIVLCYVMF